MTYRVYKSNGHKCIRKFADLDSAKVWCYTRNTAHGYRIEWTYEGESTARLMYC